MDNKSSYTEQLKIETVLDKSDFQRIQEQFDALHIGGLRKEDADALKKAYTDQQSRLQSIRKLEEDINKLRTVNSKEAKDAVKDLVKAKRQLEKEETTTTGKSELKQLFTSQVSGMFRELSSKVSVFFSDIKQRAFDMMDEMAAYSANSRIYSQEATNLRLNYGLTGKQAYAAQMASQQSGFGSFDSYLENQFFATNEQREEWQKLYKMYEKSYEQDEKVALEFQAFKKEWANMKNELATEVIHFFMENKDTIKQAAKAILEIAKGLIQFFAWYVSNFGPGLRDDEARTAATNDIIAGYAQNTNNSNISVNQTNNYNVDEGTARSVTEANNNEYRQIIAQLTGG